MIYDKTLGNIRLTVSDPAPCWVTIEYDGQQLTGMRIEELRDLRYLIDRAVAAKGAK